MGFLYGKSMWLKIIRLFNEYTCALTYLITHILKINLSLFMPQTESSFAIIVSLHMNLNPIWMWQKDSLNNKKEKRPHTGGRNLSSITVSFQRCSVRELQRSCRMQLSSQLYHTNTKAHSLPSFMPLRFFSSLFPVKQKNPALIKNLYYRMKRRKGQCIL